MVFTRRRVAVFVDGCFWHSCPAHATTPTANREWWVAKLERNQERDRQTDDHLRGLGWTVLRFWEHEDLIAAVDVIERTVRGA
jgi:DNA mismatch endonuclease (patch repair protein)